MLIKKIKKIRIRLLNKYARMAFKFVNMGDLIILKVIIYTCSRAFCLAWRQQANSSNSRADQA